MSDKSKPTQVTIYIDDVPYQVSTDNNLLAGVLSNKLNLPYFCWHPSMGSVGACRQCAVTQYQDENDTRGRMVMSCMTPAADNTWISIDDEEARQFRASVVEWLMTNHPHDCPVCAEGGHCHLQDMTVMTGHSARRYRFTKRTHQNQELGPFIAHEMNRCIACYRCVRYYQDYAGGTDLGVYGAHDNVYFGRVEDGPLESEFAGNLVEVCPTGVFTDKTHSERYNRKWDMQFAPSICHGCAAGCNISPGERYGEIRRIENRFNGSVNQYFLCDRGRFGYGYVNRPDRPRQPLMVLSQMKMGLDSALDQAAALLKKRKVIGIGSSRASLESNFALRQLVGATPSFPFLVLRRGARPGRGFLVGLLPFGGGDDPRGVVVGDRPRLQQVHHVGPVRQPLGQAHLPRRGGGRQRHGRGRPRLQRHRPIGVRQPRLPRGQHGPQPSRRERRIQSGQPLDHRPQRRHVLRRSPTGQPRVEVAQSSEGMGQRGHRLPLRLLHTVLGCVRPRDP